MSSSGAVPVELKLVGGFLRMDKITLAGGNAWKLFDSKENGIATFDKNGKVLRK